jgi:hypothetical protein
MPYCPIPTRQTGTCATAAPSGWRILGDAAFLREATMPNFGLKRLSAGPYSAVNRPRKGVPQLIIGDMRGEGGAIRK